MENQSRTSLCHGIRLSLVRQTARSVLLRQGQGQGQVQETRRPHTTSSQSLVRRVFLNDLIRSFAQLFVSLFNSL